jgi:hypothetical protein
MTTVQTKSIEQRIAWAMKYGRMALDRGDRRGAAVYAKIHRDAERELVKIVMAKQC